jgi:hypothetical protein
VSAATIDPHLLLKMLYTSLTAGIGVSLVFSLTILGVIRSSDMRRSQRTVAATSYAILATTGLILSAAIIIYGLILLGHKS